MKKAFQPGTTTIWFVNTILVSPFGTYAPSCDSDDETLNSLNKRDVSQPIPRSQASQVSATFLKESRRSAAALGAYYNMVMAMIMMIIPVYFGWPAPSKQGLSFCIIADMNTVGSISAPIDAGSRRLYFPSLYSNGALLGQTILQ